MVKRDGDDHVKQWKKDKVKEIAEKIRNSPVVGIIDIKKLPSQQFQEIRKKLRGKAEIVVTKKSIIQRAIEESGIDKNKEFERYVEGPVGLIFSSEDPFKLSRSLKENKSRASAKEGMIAEKDIVVPAGETDIPAGPALTELKMAKIDVKLDKGKIVITKDSTVAKAGDVISKEVANALNKLGIKPVEIWLHVKAFYQDGVVYPAEVLDIDEEKLFNDVTKAYKEALSLAFNIGYPTKDVVEIMLTQAHSKALSLAINAEIFTKQSMEAILSKYGSRGKALMSLLESKGYGK
ncbi:50S ribosomal protein L10 [Candidatus Micrarchaeota archaeon]|nr:MAG: 50S ribosomal protein L10 [Candidatus Micrarchaeota archaeon]